MNNKVVDFNYSYADGIHTTELILVDNTKRYIFIQYGMIYVCDCTLDELEARINNDDIDSFEAYDTTDGCSYYLNSKYSEEISDSLLHLVNTTILTTGGGI